MEVQPERLQIIEKWATWGSKRLHRWVGERGQTVDNEFYERLYSIGCISALRCPEIGERDFERWIYKSIWLESNFVYETVIRRWSKWLLLVETAKHPVHFDPIGQLEARSDLCLLRERLSAQDFDLLMSIVEEGSVTAAAQAIRLRDPRRKALVTYRAMIYSARDRARDILRGK